MFQGKTALPAGAGWPSRLSSILTLLLAPGVSLSGLINPTFSRKGEPRGQGGGTAFPGPQGALT